MLLEMPPRTYLTDGTYVYCCQYLVTFTTKYHRPVLKGAVVVRFRELLSALEHTYGFKVNGLDIIPDRVSMVVDCNPRESIQTIVAGLKRNTATILRHEYPELRTRLPCLWTRSALISTIGIADQLVIDKYCRKY